ncbi:MAG: hypothetical protein EON93_06615, partial [Burkholderiales bacterium]
MEALRVKYKGWDKYVDAKLKDKRVNAKFKNEAASAYKAWLAFREAGLRSAIDAFESTSKGRAVDARASMASQRIDLYAASIRRLSDEAAAEALTRSTDA